MEKFESQTEKATDLELALFLIKHIDDPCEDLQGNNIRDFYLREAKRALGTMRDPEAKKKLEDAIRKYSE